MKKIKLLSVFAILVIALGFYACSGNDETAKTQANCLPTNLQNGVIAFYPFNNGSINDFSGNNYHLTNTTTASSGADRAGNPSCAYNFVKANNDFLKYTNPTFLDNFQTQPFSISLWYKPTGNNWDFEKLIERPSNCTDGIAGQWGVYLHDCRRALFMNHKQVIWDTSYPNVGCTITTPALSNVWQHIVATYDGVSTIKIYRNNIATTTSNGFTNYRTCPSTAVLGDLFLGKDYEGLLDDIIIYNRVLTPTEVTELYNLSPCCQ